MERKMEKAVSISNRSTVSAKNIMLITEFLLFKRMLPISSTFASPLKGGREALLLKKQICHHVYQNHSNIS
jgi:hypothetical protein